MNIKCSFCQTPYAIGRLEKIAALQHMYTENLTHYDAHCPRCRRATPVLRQKLEMTLPNWRDALHELEQQTDSAPASASQPEAATTPKSSSKPEASPARHRARAGAKPKVVPEPTPRAPQKAKKKSA